MVTVSGVVQGSCDVFHSAFQAPVQVSMKDTSSLMLALLVMLNCRLIIRPGSTNTFRPLEGPQLRLEPPPWELGIISGAAGRSGPLSCTTGMAESISDTNSRATSPQRLSSMAPPQPGILEPCPSHARALHHFERRF